MPFKNPQQEAAMWAKAPDVAERWVHEYGHAPGYHDYRKKHPTHKKGKKSKKTKADIAIDLLVLSEHLDKNNFVKLAKQIDDIAIKIAQEIVENENTGTCINCGNLIGETVKCGSCGFSEEMLCPSCMMKKYNGNICPDCGDTFIY